MLREFVHAFLFTSIINICRTLLMSISSSEALEELLETRSIASKADSIRSWVENLPPFEPVIGKKRRRDDSTRQSAASRQHPQRHGLMDVSDNAALLNALGSPTKARGSARRRGSPRKRGAPQKRDSRPNSNQAMDIFDENANDSTDPEDTPRPLSKRKRVEDDAPSMPNTSSTASASSDRSRSPTKMAELLNLPDPMHSKVLQDLQDVDEEHPLFRVRNLLTKLRAVSSGIGILDRSTKVESLNSFVGKSS